MSEPDPSREVAREHAGRSGQSRADGRVEQLIELTEEQGQPGAGGPATVEPDRLRRGFPRNDPGESAAPIPSSGELPPRAVAEHGPLDRGVVPAEDCTGEISTVHSSREDDDLAGELRPSDEARRRPLVRTQPRADHAEREGSGGAPSRALPEDLANEGGPPGQVIALARGPPESKASLNPSTIRAASLSESAASSADQASAGSPARLARPITGSSRSAVRICDAAVGSAFRPAKGRYHQESQARPAARSAMNRARYAAALGKRRSPSPASSTLTRARAKECAHRSIATSESPPRSTSQSKTSFVDQDDPGLARAEPRGERVREPLG